MSGKEYKVGHKKPPMEYCFGRPGGNRPGETSEMRKRSIANAAKALEIRERILTAALEHSEGKSPEDILALLDAAMNTMLKDSENRGMGMPTQQVDSVSSDASMTPARIIVQGVKPSEPDE